LSGALPGSGSRAPDAAVHRRPRRAAAGLGARWGGLGDPPWAAGALGGRMASGPAGLVGRHPALVRGRL